jgi:hypothetical protein
VSTSPLSHNSRTTWERRRCVRDGLAVCTIIDSREVAQARVLARSLRTFHPDLSLCVLFLDKEPTVGDAEDETFISVPVGDVGVPNLRRILFRYTYRERIACVQPYLFQYLFSQYGVTRLLYLDPRTLILGQLTELFALLPRHSLVAPPFIAPSPLREAWNEGGVYHRGVLALADTAQTHRLLGAWQSSPYDPSASRLRQTPLPMQKWFDGLLGEHGEDCLRTNRSLVQTNNSLAHANGSVAYGRAQIDGRSLAMLQFPDCAPNGDGDRDPPDRAWLTIDRERSTPSFARRYSSLLDTAGCHHSAATGGWPHE